MGEAIGQALPLALAVALSPLAIVAAVLMLLTRQALVNALAFVVGWLVGLAIMGAVALSVVEPSDPNGGSTGPATWLTAVKLVLGGLLIVMAVRQWRGRPSRSHKAAVPRWMNAIDRFTPQKSLGTGFVFAVLSPKNLLLAEAAGTAVAQTGIPGGQQVVAYGIFATLGTVGVGTPVAVYLAIGERSKQFLDTLKHWMVQSNAVITATLGAIIGLKLLSDAIIAL